jgi:hypothetical protein
MSSHERLLERDVLEERRVDHPGSDEGDADAGAVELSRADSAIAWTACFVAE